MRAEKEGFPGSKKLSPFRIRHVRPSSKMLVLTYWIAKLVAEVRTAHVKTMLI